MQKKNAEFSSKNERSNLLNLKTDDVSKLKSIVDRKHDIAKFLAAEKIRMKHPGHMMATKSIKIVIGILKNEDCYTCKLKHSNLHIVCYYFKSNP